MAGAVTDGSTARTGDQNPRFQREHQSAALGRDEPSGEPRHPCAFLDMSYETAFRENEIDEAVPPNLTTEDLDDLGVVIAGTDEYCCRRWRGLLLRPSSPPSGSRRCPRSNRDRPSLSGQTPPSAPKSRRFRRAAGIR